GSTPGTSASVVVPQVTVAGSEQPRIDQGPSTMTVVNQIADRKVTGTEPAQALLVPGVSQPPAVVAVNNSLTNNPASTSYQSLPTVSNTKPDPPPPPQAAPSSPSRARSFVEILKQNKPSAEDLAASIIRELGSPRRQNRKRKFPFDDAAEADQVPKDKGNGKGKEISDQGDTPIVVNAVAESSGDRTHAVRNEPPQVVSGAPPPVENVTEEGSTSLPEKTGPVDAALSGLPANSVGPSGTSLPEKLHSVETTTSVVLPGSTESSGDRPTGVAHATKPPDSTHQAAGSNSMPTPQDTSLPIPAENVSRENGPRPSDAGQPPIPQPTGPKQQELIPPSIEVEMEEPHSSEPATEQAQKDIAPDTTRLPPFIPVPPSTVRHPVPPSMHQRQNDIASTKPQISAPTPPSMIKQLQFLPPPSRNRMITPPIIAILPASDDNPPSPSLEPTGRGAESEVDELMDDADETPKPSTVAVKPDVPSQPQEARDAITVGEDQVRETPSVGLPVPRARVPPKREFWVEVPYRDDLFKKAKKPPQPGLKPAEVSVGSQSASRSPSLSAEGRISRASSRAASRVDGGSRSTS
ncbi:hypothetical protein FRB90_009434, partial [Tulasnella sp. 427]